MYENLSIVRYRMYGRGNVEQKISGYPEISDSVYNPSTYVRTYISPLSLFSQQEFQSVRTYILLKVIFVHK